MMLALLLVISLGTPGATTSPPADASTASLKLAASAKNGDVPSIEYTHPHRLVDVDSGRRLNLFCSGSGSPAVILEAGGGEDSKSFRRVQARLASVTRVCSYDRAGLGFSDAARKSSTAGQAVHDLHRLIEGAAVKRPLILIGHSSGGLYAMLYAATYPDDVAGMLLIDPSFVDQDSLLTAHWTSSQRRAWRAEDLADIALTRKCLLLATEGLLKGPSMKTSPCLDSPPDTDSVLHQQLNRELARPQEQAALLSEEINTYSLEPGKPSQADIALRDTQFSFGDKPLIVLTAADQFKDMPNAARKSALAAWMQGHDALASTSTRGKNFLVFHTSHFIQIDQPEVVVRHARQVIKTVRHLNVPAP